MVDVVVVMVVFGVPGVVVVGHGCRVEGLATIPCEAQQHRAPKQPTVPPSLAVTALLPARIGHAFFASHLGSDIRSPPRRALIGIARNPLHARTHARTTQAYTHTHTLHARTRCTTLQAYTHTHTHQRQQQQ